MTDVEGDGIMTFRDLNATANVPYVTDVNGTGYIDAGHLLNDARWENGLDEDTNGFVDDLVASCTARTGSAWRWIPSSS